MGNNTMPNVGEFCWNELLTSDTNKAKDFYTSVLGWETKDIEVNIESKTYTMFMAENKGFGGIMQIPSDKKGSTPSHWISYIAVKDVMETLEKAKKLGASILKPVTVIPEKGRFVIIIDPAGATIGFWESFLRT